MIAFKEEYNAGKSPDYLRTTRFGSGSLSIDPAERLSGSSCPLLILLRDFVLDFSQAYLDVKIKEAAFEFGDIGHFAIRIFKENADIRQFLQEKYHEVIVDEYQDNNHSREANAGPAV